MQSTKASKIKTTTVSKPSDKDRVRRDLQAYENQGKLKRLAQLGTAAGLAGMGYGGYSGNKRVLLSSAGASLLSSYGAGRAQKAKDRALGRIKRHYDLRDDKLFNMNAVLPSQEVFKKHAIAGGLMEAVTGVAGMPLSHMVEMGVASLGAIPYAAKAIGAAIPAAVDLAVTPGLAKWMTNRGFDYAKVFAKQKLNKPLTSQEVKMVGQAFKAQSRVMAANADKSKLLGPVRRYFTSFLSGPAGMGSQIGEHAGSVLKQVGEFSPRYEALGLEAINSPQARDALLDTAKKDWSTLQKGVEAAKSTRLARLLTRVGKGSAPSLKQFVSGIADNPERLEEMVNNYKNIENKAVAGAKAVGLGVGGSIIANALGQMPSRHPLSKDEIPMKLTKSNK